MANLAAKIEELRAQLEDLYQVGDKSGALEVSRRLDRLIAMAQRDRKSGEVVLLMTRNQKKASMNRECVL